MSWEFFHKRHKNFDQLYLFKFAENGTGKNWKKKNQRNWRFLVTLPKKMTSPFETKLGVNPREFLLTESVE